MKFEIPAPLKAEHEELHARALVQHAQTEEQVPYPAAILVGRQVARALNKGPAR